MTVQYLYIDGFYPSFCVILALPLLIFYINGISYRYGKKKKKAIKTD